MTRASAILAAAAVGTLLQVAMVVAGHYAPAVKPFFGPGGMLISLGAGLLCALLAAPGGWTLSLACGAIAGGACALLGIGVSCALGDVPATLLAFGTLGSAAAGLVGAALARLLI